MRIPLLALCVALAACSGPPLVDMTDVDPVVYQRALDQCEAEGQSYDVAGPLIAGIIIGASAGAGLGALAEGPRALFIDTAAEGYGAAAGAAVGGAASAATGTPLALPPPPPGPRETVAQCLQRNGYRIIAPSAP